MPVTLPSSPTNCNVLLGGFTISSSTATISSISQTGVTWTFVGSSNASAVMDYEFWVGTVSTGASTSITMNCSSCAGFAKLGNISEFKGVKQSGFADGSFVPNNGSTAVTTSFTTTTAAYSNTNANDVIYAMTACTRNASPASVSAGYTFLNGASAGGIDVAMQPAYQIVSSTGAQNATFTYNAGVSGTKTWQTGIIGYKDP